LVELLNEAILKRFCDADTTAVSEQDAESKKMIVNAFAPIVAGVSNHGLDVTLAVAEAFGAWLAPSLSSRSDWLTSLHEQASLLRLALQYVDPVVANHLRDVGVALDTVAESWVRVERRECVHHHASDHFWYQFGSFCSEILEDTRDPHMRILLVDAMCVSGDDTLHFFM
jgi:hypothetical protein